ncbi:MAG: hypothetical protein QXR87_05260 [Candidatus Hadarchaeales archaeon]
MLENKMSKGAGGGGGRRCSFCEGAVPETSPDWRITVSVCPKCLEKLLASGVLKSIKMRRYFTTERGEEHRRKMSEGMRRFWERVKGETE